MRSQTLILIPLLALGACGEKAPDPRGVGHDETLLSVSATGRSETRPDEARFTAGVSTIATSAEDATRRNNETMTKVTEALKAFGVAGKDLQTRQLTVNRIDWGANKGKYEAVNQVEVRMRAVDKAGEGSPQRRRPAPMSCRGRRCAYPIRKPRPNRPMPPLTAPLAPAPKPMRGRPGSRSTAC